MNNNCIRDCFGTQTLTFHFHSQISLCNLKRLTCHAQGFPCWADSLHIYIGINSISWGKRQHLLEIQVWAGMAICAHHATLIHNDTPGNAASRFICNANLPPDHTNMAQQSDTEGANCAEVANSNMRAYNWRTRSVCVKNDLHISSTVSVRWWNIISWNTHSVHARHFLAFIYLFSPCIFCLFACRDHSVKLFFVRFKLALINQKAAQENKHSPKDYHNDAGLALNFFAITSVNTRPYSQQFSEKKQESELWIIKE